MPERDTGVLMRIPPGLEVPDTIPPIPWICDECGEYLEKQESGGNITAICNNESCPSNQ